MRTTIGSEIRGWLSQSSKAAIYPEGLEDEAHPFQTRDARVVERGGVAFLIWSDGESQGRTAAKIVDLLRITQDKVEFVIKLGRSHYRYALGRV